MTLMEAFVTDEVFIDFETEIIYGSDQVNICYPCRFPTVGFQLMETNGLIFAALCILHCCRGEIL